MTRIGRKLKTLLGRPAKSAAAAAAVPALALEALAEPARAHAAEARAHFLAGEYVAALRTVEKALAAGPAGALEYFRGCCLDQVGRHEEALAAYEQALALEPGHVAAGERAARLQKALARPERVRIATADRRYGSSLPRETLRVIQQSLHNYHYRGVPMLKDPFDMALYPMLLWQLKPRTIFEIGSKSGGSGLWLGDLVTSFGLDTRILSIDIVRVDAVTHPRVQFIEGDGRRLGDSLPDTLLAGLPRPWLVIEDADHVYETSIAVLRFFHPRLEAGEYIVVEDGIISDLAGIPDCNSGPHRAIKEFLGAHRGEYEIDGDYCDFFGYNATWSTNGFLRKLAPGADGMRSAGAAIAGAAVAGTTSGRNGSGATDA